MDNIRCRCGKIVCQVANIPDQTEGKGDLELRQTPAVVILCRHCKARVVLHVPTIIGVDIQSGPQRLSEVPFFGSIM